MRRTPIAHVVFPRADPVRPVLDFVWDAASAIAATRDLDVDVLVPIPHRHTRGPQATMRRFQGKSAWPEDIEERLRNLDPRPTLVPYVPLPRRSLESAAIALALHLVARRRAGRPVVIQGSFLDEGGFAAATAARVLGCASIAVAHGSDVRAARGELPGARGRKRRALSTVRRATRILAVSDHLAQELALLGVRAELLRFTTPADRFPERPPFVDGPPEILFVGLVSRAKGVDLLLEALALLAHRQARLRIVGPTAGDLDVAREAARLGVADRVFVEGEMEQRELASRYARAACVALPSRSEGFGIVLIEALLTGRPIVGAAIGGIREIVSDQVGRLVPPEDPRSLGAAIDDVLALAREGHFAPAELRLHALPMTWEAAGPRLADLTRALIDAR